MNRKIRITRIGRDKTVDEACDIIKIDINGTRLTLTPNIDGGLMVHKDQMDDREISIVPCCANVIVVK